MILPAANGQRFLASSGKAISMLEIAGILQAGLGAKAARVPKKGNTQLAYPHHCLV